MPGSKCKAKDSAVPTRSSVRHCRSDRASMRGLKRRRQSRATNAIGKTYTQSLHGERWEFVTAVDEFKRLNCRKFIAISEIFDVMKFLGYRKVAPRAVSIDGPFPEPRAEC